MSAAELTFQPRCHPLSYASPAQLGRKLLATVPKALVKGQDICCLKDLYHHAKRGLQVYLKDIDYSLIISWFWLKRTDGKRELRFVTSTYPDSGAYLVQLGRKRWAIVDCCPQDRLFQNRQASVWSALFWSRH